MTAEKIPPANVQAEQALLGVVLRNNDVYRTVASIVDVDQFADPTHRAIWSTISKVIEDGRSASPVTCQTYFNGSGIGGAPAIEYLSRLRAAATASANAVDYAMIIRDLAAKREMIGIGEHVVEMCFNGSIDLSAEKIFSRFENAMGAVRPTVKASEDYASFDDVLDQAARYADEVYKADGVLTGLSTGLPRLDDVVGGLQKSDLIILAGRPGMGKCQDIDSPILMSSGEWVRMGDLKFGDSLASIDGRPSFVSGIYPQGIKERFRVTFSDRRSTLCGGDHLWQVLYRDWDRPRVLTTEELRKKLQASRYNNRLYVPLVDGSFGAKVDLPVEPYLLGVLLGNGCFRSGNSVRFSSVDIDTIRAVVSALNEEMKISVAGKCDYRLVKSHNSNEFSELRRTLGSLGLWGLGSHEKFVPSIYLKADRARRLRLLQGLMDTDGWSEKSGCVRFLSTSLKLAENVVDLVRSLGGLASIKVKDPCYIYKGERKQAKEAYVVQIRHQNGHELFSLGRKRSRAVRISNTVRLNVVSIEPEGEAEMQCIMVTHPSSLYVTDDYVVTHNSAIATNIAFNVGRELKARRDAGERTGVVAFHSLEMTGEQLGFRVLSEQSEVPFWKLRRKIAEPEEVQRFIEAKRDIAQLPVHIDAQPGLNVSSLRMRVRALRKRHGLELVIVDYLQLLAGIPASKAKDFSRASEVTEITGALKNLAKELNVPVIALSQLSRRVEERPDNKPRLSDLRESGSIEQDADVVLFVFREEYYVKSAKPKEGTDAYLRWERDMWRAKGVAEVIVEKNRHGPTGTATLGFLDQITKFVNEPPDREAEPLVGSQEGVQGRYGDGAPKPARLPPKALTALGLLRDLNLNEAVVNDSFKGVPYEIKTVIPYPAWRERCAIGLLDADKALDDKARAKLMEEILPSLMSNGYVGRAGTKDSAWVWITAKGMKR